MCASVFLNVTEIQTLTCVLLCLSAGVTHSLYEVAVSSVLVGCAGEQEKAGRGSGLSYRDGQGAPGWGLSGVGPVRVGRTALWKHGRETSWCVRLSRGGGGGGGGRDGCVSWRAR